jgi:hypothetical protein
LLACLLDGLLRRAKAEDPTLEFAGIGKKISKVRTVFFAHMD